MGNHCDACGKAPSGVERLTKVGRHTLCEDCRAEHERTIE